jgi:hypothetical protein
MNDQKTKLAFFRLALAGFTAGLTGCSILFPAPVDPRAQPADAYPQPVSFGESAMEAVRLSGHESSTAERAQVLVDKEGSAYFFWVEREYGDSDPVFVLRVRDSVGSWGEPERISTDIFETDPVFLWGGDGNPCYTYSDNWNSPILRLRCRTDRGWEEAPQKGYAELYPYDLNMFPDGGRLVTAFRSMESTGGILYFGETSLTEESTDVRGLDMARAPDGAYIIAYSVSLTSDDVNRLVVIESSDGGRTWTKPVILSENAVLSPRLLVAEDGTVFAVWGDYHGLRLAFRPPAHDWRVREIAEWNADYYYPMDIFIGQDKDGTLHILFETYEEIYSLAGTLRNGFSVPEMILSDASSGFRFRKFSAAFGLDGSVFLAWTAYLRDGYRNGPPFGGWVSAGE